MSAAKNWRDLAVFWFALLSMVVTTFVAVAIVWIYLFFEWFYQKFLALCHFFDDIEKDIRKLDDECRSYDTIVTLLPVEPEDGMLPENRLTQYFSEMEQI